MTAIPQQIIDYLNNKADRSFRLTPKHLKFIQARIKEGYLLEDFEKVVDNMVRDWANDSTMYKYLRPETLFGNKFDGYLNTPPAPLPKEKVAAINKKSHGNDWKEQFEGEMMDPKLVLAKVAEFKENWRAKG